MKEEIALSDMSIINDLKAKLFTAASLIEAISKELIISPTQAKILKQYSEEIKEYIK